MVRVTILNGFTAVVCMLGLDRLSLLNLSCLRTFEFRISLGTPLLVIVYAVSATVAIQRRPFCRLLRHAGDTEDVF